VKRRLPLVAIVCAAAAIATPVFAAPGGNGNGNGNAGNSSGNGNSQHDRWVAPPRDSWAGHSGDATNVTGCDPLDGAQCLLPFPNDWLTKPDASSTTGRRVDLTLPMMPRNVAGKPIEPQEWNRSDGFSAGAQILTVVPGMTKNSDLAPSGLPPVTDLGRNSRDDLGVVLLDEETGRRWPVWAELDQYVDETGLLPAGTVGSVQHDLMIHPATNLADGHRYIVALRHLVTDDGTVAQPSAAFTAYRDGTAPATDSRRAHMDNLFATLKQAGVGRKDLYLAWDFTTASTTNVTGRLVAMRNDAFAQLGDTALADGISQGHAPAFTVDTVANLSPDQDSKVARRITGHFTVPCYLAPTCEPPTKCTQASQNIVDDCPTPGQFLLDPTNPDAVPSQTPGQTYQANFICNVGRKAFGDEATYARSMRPVEYGHGLFGGAGEVNSDPQKTMANDRAMVYCATDWTGMATADVPNAAIALNDLSRFPFLTDRVQQGELNFLYLARLMVHPQGFTGNAAFQWADGTPFLDIRQAFYDGNSQGGIYGGTVCAVSVDVRHCVLGVPGMNYSILLPRSSDYVATKPLSAYDPTQVDPQDPTSARDQIGYSSLLDNAYPDQSQRMVILDLIQMLWDRSDPNGYASHMTGGLPGTPSHQVLLQVAYGDHQVANITAETEARTIGARGARPPLVAGRYGPYVDPLWGIQALPSDEPWRGSGITLFDSGPATNRTTQGHLGTDPPPTADVPNRSGDDPHEAPRRALCGQQQKDAFLAIDGVVTLPCGGAPYFSWGWDGVTGL
jgi:hypothetical protein